jgi:alkylation response protein AidB-like acyl-CoA dehydrogenase
MNVPLPDEPIAALELSRLCRKLAQATDELDRCPNWPLEQLQWCGQAGVYRWFLPSQWGGLGWSEAQIAQGYLQLSAACLTTAFIITQRVAACRRIAASDNEDLKRQILPDLADGTTFATVGISHLTTSRRHLARPVLTASPAPRGYLLHGYSPWVTGGQQADTIVLGATCDDGRQVLLAVPRNTPGMHVLPHEPLIALTASQTGRVEFQNAFVPAQRLVAGPTENVLQHGGAGTGGLQTSALALGLSGAAMDYLEQERAHRPDLSPPTAALRDEWNTAVSDLMALAQGMPVCTLDQFRFRANSLALRTTQASLAAAKGAGYVVGHPAGRWCREALFFLVWSCPAGVVNANLCELAGIQD